MNAVLANAGIVAARKPDNAADTAGDDGIVQRPVGTPVLPALHVFNVLVGEPGDHICRFDVGRSNIFFLAVREIIDRETNDLLGDDPGHDAHHIQYERRPSSCPWASS